MTGCHYNGDGLSLFEPVFIEEGRGNYADRTVYAASEGKDRSNSGCGGKGIYEGSSGGSVDQPHEMTQHFVSQVRKFPDFLTISKRTVAAVPGKRTKE